MGNKGVEYSKVAEACGLIGIKAETPAELEQALSKAIDGQMKRNETTLIEVVLNQELGEPFRRDAMTAPVKVSGISAGDMQALAARRFSLLQQSTSGASLV